jgi:hypothetical protein
VDVEVSVVVRVRAHADIHADSPPSRIHAMEWVFLAVGGVLFSFVVGGYFAGRGH